MVTGSPGIAIARVEHYLREIMYIFPHIPVLKQAALEDIGGLYGAMEFCKQKQGT